MKIHRNIFKEIISIEQLFTAWSEFKKGKGKKKDVMLFEVELEHNLFQLQKELASKKYKHGDYSSFYITDPKQRHIHKAAVKDRVVHHSVFSILNPIFEPTFISTSYSCRIGKGSHKAVNKLRSILRKKSGNNSKPCYVLKCDIKKFFQSVDHTILLSLLQSKIKDPEAIWLLKEIIESFPAGVPIGNLTSQLFANVYLAELDNFVKHTLKVPFYIRYTDDFAMVSNSVDELNDWLKQIKPFLENTLKLSLHPAKVILRKYHQGVDFLGYVQYPHHRQLRTKTKRRILKKLNAGVKEEALHSYLGVLSHANSHKLAEEIKNQYWFNKT